MVARSALLSICLFLLLAGCSDKEPSGPGGKNRELKVSPDSASLFVGDTIDLSAKLFENNVEVSGAAISWMSSDTAVVAIIGGSRGIGKKVGSAVLTAASAGVTATLSITVKAKPTRELRVTPDSALLLLGDSISLSARLFENNVEVSDAIISWTSSDSSVVRIVGGTRAVAQSVGSAILTAASAGLSARLRVTVRLGSATTSCSGTGTMHESPLNSTSWLAKDSPHFIRGEINVASALTIEAGALICAYPGSWFRVAGGKLTAVGTTDKPIRFLPVDGTQGWNGIGTGGYPVGGSIELAHVDVVFGRAIGSSMQIDDSHFVKTGLFAGGNFSAMTVRNSVIDSADVQLAAGAFENNIIRAGGLSAIYAQPGSALKVDGGRIEDSPGTAFTVGSTFSGRIPNITVVNPPIITGSRGSIANMPIGVFLQSWPTPEKQAALLNNVNHTVQIWGSASDSVHLRGGLKWSISGGVLPTANYKTLTLDAGASLDVGYLLTVSDAFTAVGSNSAPVTISSSCAGYSVTCGINFSGNGASKVSYAIVKDAYLNATDEHVIKFDHISSNGFITLSARNSSISDAELFDVSAYSFAPQATLMLGGEDVRAERITVRRTSGTTTVVTRDSANNPVFSSPRVAAVGINGNNITLTGCEIVDNAGDGIVVLAGANVSVHDCNIERNGGIGLNNRSNSLVDARSNWWGDPGGPQGPSGDGVFGNVDFTQAYAQRRTSLFTPRSMTLSTANASLSTPDTLRVLATIRDADGNQLGSERTIWRSSDPNVAMVDANEAGLIVARHAGVATITVMSATDTTLRATVNVTVTAAGPSYRWTREDINATTLSRIWGSAPNDIYVTSPVGLFHFDGTRWSAVAGGPAAASTIVGRAGNDFFVQVSSAEIWHWNGSAWSKHFAPSNVSRMTQVGPNDLIVLADNGVYRMLDGGWSFVFKPMEDFFSGTTLWARSVSDIFVGGNYETRFQFGGAVQRWNGSSLSWLQGSPPAEALTGTSRYVYAIGSDYDTRLQRNFMTTSRFDGSTWESLAINPSAQQALRDVWADSDDKLVAGGGTAVFVFDNNTWWTPWTGYRAQFGPVWRYGDDVYVIGSQTDSAGRTFYILLHGVRE